MFTPQARASGSLWRRPVSTRKPFPQSILSWSRYQLFVSLKIKVGPGVSAISSGRILQHFCICFLNSIHVFVNPTLIKCAEYLFRGPCVSWWNLSQVLSRNCQKKKKKEVLKIWVKDMHVLCHPEIPLLVIYLTESHAYMHQDMTKAVHWSSVCNSPKLGGRQGECSKSVERINKLGQKSYTGTLHSTKMNKILL